MTSRENAKGPKTAKVYGVAYSESGEATIVSEEVQVCKKIVKRIGSRNLGSRGDHPVLGWRSVAQVEGMAFDAKDAIEAERVEYEAEIENMREAKLEADRTIKHCENRIVALHLLGKGLGDED